MASSWLVKYPEFIPDPHAPLQDEFTRLARLRSWKQDSKRYRKEWRQCVEQEFSAYFGQDAGRVEGWQSLCAELGIRNVPTSITACRKALRGIWVNIVDLIDCRRTGQQVQRHASMKALRKYIRDTGKVFPKEAAKQNGFLKAFLITVFE